MDLAPLLAGGNDDLADKGTQRLGGLPAAIGITQSFGEARDITAVVRSYIRVNIRHIGRAFAKRAAISAFWRSSSSIRAFIDG